MSRLAKSLIDRKGENAVWRIRLLGARDSVTGHPEVTWLSGIFFDCDCFDPDCFICDSNINVIRSHISTREDEIMGTRFTKKVVTFFTWAPLKKYDEVEYHGSTFVVESTEYKYWLDGSRSYQKTVMVEK